MSMNLTIAAERKVKVKGTGKVKKEYRRLSRWQTPTDVTYSIIAQADPLKAYCDWVLSVSKDEEEPVYAKDDIFGEREPVGYRVYNAGKEHVEELQKKIQELVEEGWDICMIAFN